MHAGSAGNTPHFLLPTRCTYHGCLANPSDAVKLTPVNSGEASRRRVTELATRLSPFERESKSIFTLY
jgi:hypothetical protein